MEEQMRAALEKEKKLNGAEKLFEQSLAAKALQPNACG
jgi:hypothetical protein